MEEKELLLTEVGLLVPTAPTGMGWWWKVVPGHFILAPSSLLLVQVFLTKPSSYGVGSQLRPMEGENPLKIKSWLSSFTFQIHELGK